MNKIISAIHLISVLLLLSGCTHPQPQSAGATSSVQTMKNSKEAVAAGKEPPPSKNTRFLTGDMFKQDSDFVIKAFDISYDKSQQVLSYHIEYKLGAEATAFLQSGKHKYFFRLEAPDQWRSSFQTFQSNGIEGARLTGDSENIYAVDIPMPLRDGLSEETIQKMRNDRYDYALYLYENPAFTARIIDNVYGYMKHF